MAPNADARAPRMRPPTTKKDIPLSQLATRNQQRPNAFASMSAAQRPTRFKSRFARPNDPPPEQDDDQDIDDENETLLARDRAQDEDDSLLDQQTGEGEGTRDASRRVSAIIRAHPSRTLPTESSPARPSSGLSCDC